MVVMIQNNITIQNFDTKFTISQVPCIIQHTPEAYKIGIKLQYRYKKMH